MHILGETMPFWLRKVTLLLYIELIIIYICQSNYELCFDEERKLGYTFNTDIYSWISINKTTNQ